MTQSIVCRLCVSDCKEYKSLYYQNGSNNELYEMTREYFHPKIVDMEKAKHLTALCLDCFRQVCEFHSFQASVLVAQLKLIGENQLSDEHQDVDSEILEHHMEIKVENEVILEPCVDAVFAYSSDSQEVAAYLSQQKCEVEVDYSSDSQEDAAYLSQQKCEEDVEYINGSIDMDTISKDDGYSPDMEETTFEPIGAPYTAENCMAKTELPTKEEHESPRPQFECNLCGRTFTLKNNLNRHMYRQHSKIRRNKIARETVTKKPPTEEAKADVKPDLQTRHMNRRQQSRMRRLRRARETVTKKSPSTKVKEEAKHEANDITSDHDNSDPAFQCHLCDQSFTLKRNLKRHVDFKHSKNLKAKAIKCNLCACYLRDTYELKKHMHSRHTNKIKAENHNDSFKCNFCDRSYLSKKSLVRHLKKNHNEVQRVQAVEAVDSKSKSHHYSVMKNGSFKCKLCERIYTLKYNLQRHLFKSHSEAHKAEYECQICQKKFISPMGLKHHNTVLHPNTKS